MYRPQLRLGRGNLSIAKIIITALAMLLFSAGGAAADGSPGQVAEKADVTDRIQNTYETLAGFTADFEQTLINSATTAQEVRGGSMAYLAEGYLRWEVQGPDPELLVVRPDVVWDYFAADGLAIKYAREQVLSSATMLKLLSGRANLKQDFKVLDESTDNSLTLLTLSPKEPEPTMVEASVWVEPETALIRSIEVVDFYGNINRVQLSNVSLNPDLTPADFAFSPPAGVMIQNNATGQQPAAGQ